ncbi:MAG: Endonuclease III, partial [uncultured Nocardioidaceae bacterium]
AVLRLRQRPCRRCRRRCGPPRHGAGAAGAQDRPAARGGVPRRALRARLRHPVPAGRRHGAERPDHRQAGQLGDTGPVRGVPGPGLARRRGPQRRRADHPADRLLPGQDRRGARARAGARRAVRRGGAGTPRGARHAPGGRPQDGERRPGRRLRPAGDHRRHPRRAALATVRLDGRDRPGQGRARGRPALPEAGLDAAQPPPHLPRPPGLPRAQTRLRGVPGGAAVPVVRRGADRPGDGRRPGPHRGARV